MNIVILHIARMHAQVITPHKDGVCCSCGLPRRDWKQPRQPFLLASGSRAAGREEVLHAGRGLRAQEVQRLLDRR